MKRILELILGFGFWITLILMMGSVESDQWGWTILYFGLFVLVCVTANKIYEKDINEKDKKEEN